MQWVTTVEGDVGGVRVVLGESRNGLGDCDGYLKCDLALRVSAVIATQAIRANNTERAVVPLSSTTGYSSSAPTR